MILIWSRARLLPSVVFFDNVDYNFHLLIIFFIGGALDISYSATPALGGFFYTVDYIFHSLLIFFTGGALDIPYSVTPGGRIAG